MTSWSFAAKYCSAVRFSRACVFLREKKGGARSCNVSTAAHLLLACVRRGQFQQGDFSIAGQILSLCGERIRVVLLQKARHHRIFATKFRLQTVRNRPGGTFSRKRATQVGVFFLGNVPPGRFRTVCRRNSVGISTGRTRAFRRFFPAKSPYRCTENVQVNWMFRDLDVLGHGVGQFRK